ncbi:enoyl-CoA hydratase-related protein [Plasticicumulans acidivorans]|uniref:enoyl-CoA hydratase-related protein n=1 Tax=Plasticicumulans acidivorans TaxID=886464 RepID=UPI0024822232|nr:enoyl-CoA hydratase-related protein [Plasticicumulans acidivorans]
MPDYAHLRVERHDAVGLITLHRPQALNALSAALLRELAAALLAFEQEPAIGAIVLTGSERAFAAGADIRELEEKAYIDLFLSDFPNVRGDAWGLLGTLRKPLIAAVAGHCLGGGCELAMACDFILAADTARFGQPEIGIGTMPGAGGTQRLTRAIGKAKAMEMCLSGRTLDAAEAERAGLVSRVLPAAELLDEALRVAARIAAQSQPVAWAIKEAVNVAFETSLAEGLRFERRLFQTTFALDDHREGMRAFVARRAPRFSHR